MVWGKLVLGIRIFYTVGVKLYFTILKVGIEYRMIYGLYVSSYGRLPTVVWIKVSKKKYLTFSLFITLVNI